MFLISYLIFLMVSSHILHLSYMNPRTANGEVQCVELTLGLLQDKIHDTTFPFGHGYIIAGYFKDIEPDEYIK